jgi:hypothetical protein
VPTEVDYARIVNTPEFDICGKFNRGEIDEVWIYNGPWFGFYESRLVGINGYQFNSNPLLGNNDCAKALPIMGPSVERTRNEAIHNFTHRTEATMAKAYGSWQQNRTAHNWDKFALVKAQSPDYSYSAAVHLIILPMPQEITAIPILPLYYRTAMILPIIPTWVIHCKSPNR